VETFSDFTGRLNITPSSEVYFELSGNQTVPGRRVLIIARKSKTATARIPKT
jgi:hypothetical protein